MRCECTTSAFLSSKPLPVRDFIHTSQDWEEELPERLAAGEEEDGLLDPRIVVAAPSHARSAVR